MVHVMARITLKPDAAAAGRRIMETLAAATRQEPGCLAYELFQQADAPHVFQTVERWADQRAVDAHMASPQVATAIEAAGPMFAQPPEILAFTPIA